MRSGIQRAVLIAALALAVSPASALAAGGLPGGGGAAVPVGGGGGGLNSGGARVPTGGGSPTAIQLSGNLFHTIDSYVFGSVSYKDDGSRRNLRVNAGFIGVGLIHPSVVDVVVDGNVQAELPAPADGKISYTADSGSGDNVPALHAGSNVSIVDPGYGILAWTTLA
jgi:hypothetical protein